MYPKHEVHVVRETICCMIIKFLFKQKNERGVLPRGNRYTIEAQRCLHVLSLSKIAKLDPKIGSRRTSN